MLGLMDSAAPSLGLGIDFGGTGIKAALIDMTSGELLSSRVRVATPKPSTPEAVAATIESVIGRVAKDHPIPDGIPVGIGLPGVVKDGLTMTAANIDKAWIGTSADAVVGAALGRRVYAMNDADAAGLAEVRLGAGRDRLGTVLMLTVGTGIGSGLFVDGDLVPNTELGHLEVNGRDAETRVSALARERRRLRWKTWATEFNEYLARIEAYLWPDLIILGGGVSKVMDKYAPLLKSRAPIVPAQYRNTSGIIGAALNAADRTRIDAMRGFATNVAALATPSPAEADGPAPVAEPLTTLVAPATDTDRAVVAEVKPAG
jgi:polyphosphate glucokinase